MKKVENFQRKNQKIIVNLIDKMHQDVLQKCQQKNITIADYIRDLIIKDIYNKK